MQRPFPYQVALEEALKICWRVRKRRRVVTSLPVGGGKTTVASRIARACLRGLDTSIRAVMEADGWITVAMAHQGNSLPDHCMNRLGLARRNMATTSVDLF